MGISLLVLLALHLQVIISVSRLKNAVSDLVVNCLVLFFLSKSMVLVLACLDLAIDFVISLAKLMTVVSQIIHKSSVKPLGVCAMCIQEKL